MAASIPSKWCKTLESRLGKLSESSSKESFQTLARWIVFHRKHLGEFKDPVLAKLATPRSAVAVSVLNALFLLYKGKSDKWSELADLRVKVAEHCFLDSNIVIAKEGASAIETHLEEWGSEGCFGSSQVIPKLKQKLNGETQSQEATRKEPIEETAAGSTSSISNNATDDDGPIAEDDDGPIAEDDDVPMEDHPVDTADPEVPSPTTDKNKEDDILGSLDKKRKIVFGDDKPGPSKRNKSPIPDIESVNFDELGIPERAVDPTDLLDECRTIATLQIGRDLRAEKVHRVANLLQQLPEKVRSELASLSSDPTKIDDKTADEFSRLVSDELLDLDLAVHLAAVRSNRTLVEQQNASRLSMIRLLQESRCKFGAMETGRIYYDPEITDISYYKEEAQELADLLDLEGLDVDDVLAAEDKLEEAEQPFEDELPPIDWYQDEIGSKKTAGA